MNGEKAIQSCDELLLPFLETTDPAESRRLLGDILEKYVTPVIKGIIRHKLFFSVSASCSWQSKQQHADDLFGEIVASLLERLHSLRENPQNAAIANLTAYAAITTFNACDKYLRQKYPERRRLRNRVQYLLTHGHGFDLWENEAGNWLCGLEDWRGRREVSDARARWSELRQRLSDFEKKELSGQNAKSAAPAVLVAAILRWMSAPVELDALVDLLGELWEIQEGIFQQYGDETKLEHRIGMGSCSRDPSKAVEERIYMERLWLEICQLPIKQRCAILLNLKDDRGCSAIELFSFLGIATIRQIAGALEIPTEEFAALWNHLPLDDATIGERLGATRQQVINLRKCARERLARRMKDF